MGIETNYKFMLEEYEGEVLKLERLNNFVKGEEFSTLDETQKRIVTEKCELLTKYVAKLKEQIDYDKNIIEEKACCISEDGNYDEIGKCYIK